jgi:predicted amidohydrolase YtcJ
MNAKVFTADSDQPNAEAIIIQGNRILYVGSNAKAESFRGTNTRVIDAKGRTVLPGFIDSHFHLLNGAKELRFAQLQRVRSLEMLREELVNYAESGSRSEWIAGIGLVYGILPDGKSITRQHLDSIIPDRPVFLVAYDGHTSWANTEALRRADLLNGREMGTFSKVMMGADGLATGELREAAGNFVEDLIPAVTDDEQLELLARAVKMAAGYGLTSVHNMNGDIKDLHVYQKLEARGEMFLRVYVPFLVFPNMKPRRTKCAAGWSNFLWTALSSRIRVYCSMIMKASRAIAVHRNLNPNISPSSRSKLTNTDCRSLSIARAMARCGACLIRMRSFVNKTGRATVVIASSTLSWLEIQM